MKHSDQKGAPQKSLWEEQSLQNAKNNNKTTKKKSSDRRRPSKHSENKWHLCKAGSFTYSESPRTPPLEGTSLHQWNNSVERPWGILSLFTNCLCLCVKSPCHRQKELGTRRCMKTPQRKHSELREPFETLDKTKTVTIIVRKTQRKNSELKEPYEMLHKAKTLTTIARQKKAKEKALKRTRQTGKKPYKNTEKNRAYKMLKGTTKPLWRRVLIEEGLAKSSKKKHSEKTDKWHLCKAGSFSCGE